MKVNDRLRKSREQRSRDSDLLSVGDMLQTLHSCNKFLHILQNCGMEERLSGAANFTLLAPLDKHIEKLPKNFFSFLERNPHRLLWFANLHIIADKVNKEDLADMEVIKTLSGELFDTKAEGHDVLIDGMSIVEPDIMCRNGIIHTLGGVLWPK